MTETNKIYQGNTLDVLKTFPDKRCKFCGISYHSTDKRRKFCCLQCYWKFSSKYGNIGFFRKGQIPWNKNIKGIHFSPSTEFKKGNNPINWKPIETISYRIDNNGVLRYWIKIKEPNIWIELSKYIWVKAGRNLRKGMLLHHINNDSSDDRLENLMLISRKQHPKLHSRWNTRNVFYKENKNGKLKRKYRHNPTYVKMSEDRIAHEC